MKELSTTIQYVPQHETLKLNKRQGCLLEEIGPANYFNVAGLILNGLW